MPEQHRPSINGGRKAAAATAPAGTAKHQHAGSGCRSCIPDISCRIIHIDELLLHYVELLEAVRVLWVRNISDMLEYLSCIDGLPSIPVMLSCCFLQCKGLQRCRRGSSAQQSGHRSEIGLKEPITHLVDPCSACMHHWVGVDQWLIHDDASAL